MTVLHRGQAGSGHTEERYTTHGWFHSTKTKHQSGSQICPAPTTHWIFIEALFQTDEMLSMRGVPQTAIHGHVRVQLMKPSKSREGGGLCATFNMACTFYFIKIHVNYTTAVCTMQTLPTAKQRTTYTNSP